MDLCAPETTMDLCGPEKQNLQHELLLVHQFIDEFKNEKELKNILVQSIVHCLQIV